MKAKESIIVEWTCVRHIFQKTLNDPFLRPSAEHVKILNRIRERKISVSLHITTEHDTHIEAAKYIGSKLDTEK